MRNAASTLVAAIAAVVVAPQALSSAQADYSVTRFPIDGNVTVACGGTEDVVHVSGSYLVRVGATLDAAGGTHTTFEIVSQGIRGESLTTGTKYVFPGVQIAHQNVDEQFEGAVMGRGFGLTVGQGTGPLFALRFETKVTFQNGELRVDRMTFVAECV